MRALFDPAASKIKGFTLTPTLSRKRERVLFVAAEIRR